MIIPFPRNGEHQILDISVIRRGYYCHSAVIDKTVQRAGKFTRIIAVFDDF